MVPHLMQSLLGQKAVDSFCLSDCFWQGWWLVLIVCLRFSSSSPSGPMVELHCPTPLEIRRDHMTYFEEWSVIGADVSFLDGSFKRQCAICCILFPSVTGMGTSLDERVFVRWISREEVTWRPQSTQWIWDISHCCYKVVRVGVIVYYCSLMLPTLTQINNNKSNSKLGTIWEEKTVRSISQAICWVEITFYIMWRNIYSENINH